MKHYVTFPLMVLTSMLLAVPGSAGNRISGDTDRFPDGPELRTGQERFFAAAGKEKVRKKAEKKEDDPNWIIIDEKEKEEPDDIILKDDSARKLSEDRKRRTREVHFTMGLQSGLNVQEGYARIFAIMPMGIFYRKFTFTFNPMFLYLKSDSIKRESKLGKLSGVKGGGLIYETGLSFEVNYHFFDLSKYKFTPFLYAGPGYNYRFYSYHLKSVLGGLARNSYKHSLTAHFGFGLAVRAGKYMHLRFGLGGISYFNKSKTEFGYDTTGISFNFGASVVFK